MNARKSTRFYPYFGFSYIIILLYSKNIGGDKLWQIWQITAFPQVFYNFHNIPYANGLQFAEVFSAKLPTVLIC